MPLSTIRRKELNEYLDTVSDAINSFFCMHPTGGLGGNKAMHRRKQQSRKRTAGNIWQDFGRLAFLDDGDKFKKRTIRRWLELTLKCRDSRIVE